ncbi:MAG: ABC transporter [Candidatus Firestonebacteria bacterium RIFOXYC2_FULL_39_67]|nr:MAG: ABC transporter [Candidatus Firestonebacteria bacterium RIFOXYD2_FULL_39_29]OGF57076.1 MAG: ABC transporter [Candidatus Firestonebacteria bacterium RIFOXYC2_FULL_39_67]OGF57241.1 MAG: ABC transporter [Candidatus Firestonebacteria bacterium RifOxyC12_full_39_7]
MLELKNISKTYLKSKCDVLALKNISLALKPKDFVVVQGSSGCGKTTLLLIAGGLLKPDSGKVLMDNRDFYTLSSEKRAQIRALRIGFVFQQFFLIPYLNVLDNILSASLGVKTKQTKERAMELIKHFDLENRINHFPSELSTGERQRVALARAVFNKPKLILADEPTGNLDAKNAAIVVSYLKEFAKKGSAVLLVTHSTKIAKSFKNRIRL